MAGRPECLATSGIRYSVLTKPTRRGAAACQKGIDRRMQTYTTAAVARRVGVHPNTVRLYETIGWITSPARRPNGYRVFTEKHILQLRLVQIWGRA